MNEARSQRRNGRLDEDLLARFRQFSVRVLNLTYELEQLHVPKRIIDQLVGSGTSPGAQMYEACEAVSQADFIRLLGIASKELGETCYWLQIICDMEWINEQRIDPLRDEAQQLRRIVRTMIIRTRNRKSAM